MYVQSVIQMLASDTHHAASRYAIVDCAATHQDDLIYSKIISDDVQKHNLFTGENALIIEHCAPFLVPLDSQPELEQWLIENGWGKGWGIFFTSRAGIKTLLGHLRPYLNLQAPNGRDIFFRFYDPIILGDLLSVLSPQEAMAFFGPMDRFVIENPQGEPVVFEKPQGEHTAAIAPSTLVLETDKREQLAKRWRTRLLDQHVEAYRNLGFTVAPDVTANALTIEDPSGATARLTKTAAGVTATTGEQRRFQYELTTCKHPAAVTDPAGNIIDFDIQERDNNEKRNTLPIINAIRMDTGEKTWVFDYDDMHHLARIDYPDGACAKTCHDSYGNLTDIVDRNGNVSQYEYDFDERLTQFKDANGHTTRFDYEDLTAPATIAFADGTAFGFEYTDAGALAKFLAGNTLVADYQVDPDSGCWQVNYMDGGHAEFVVKSGKIVRAANAAGTVELAYDDAGNLIEERFQNRCVTYHRNETGQLTGITTPFGQTIRYSRDKENRVCGIHAWSGRDMTIQYAPNGAFKAIVYPNGTRLEQQTNAQGLPTRMHLHGPDGILFYNSFQRDRLNRITRVKDGEQEMAYHYDREGRLLKAQSSDGDINQTFTLDAKANRLADNNTRYRVNTADRITQAGRLPFQYDKLGNLNQGTCPCGGADFTYTDLNRLKSIALKNGRVHYLYDAFGRRVAKKVNGITTRYYWAQSQLLHEAQVRHNEEKDTVGVTDYLFFPQAPVLLAIRQNRQIRWAAFGHRYEVLCLTNEGGQLVWQARYDAFGQAHVQLGEDIHQPFRLPGQYHDRESGLHYNLARYYDPSQGRFLSLDPLFLEGGSQNFYAYCNGDPINHIDPSGEFIFCAILIGAAIGAAIGGGIEALRQHRQGEETDGFKIAGAALMGGIIGAIGGGVGAAVEAAAAAGTLGTAMASSALPAMAGVGFLSGAGASAAEQCAEAQMTGKGIDPLAMTQQALTDGVIGAGTALVTFGVGGFMARKLRKAKALFRPAQQTERAVELAQTSKKLKSRTPASAKKKGRRASDHADKSTVGEPVNAVTGEVILAQTDFTLPGRIPLIWTRHYGSQCDHDGVLGRGWQTPADARLMIDSSGLVTFCDGSPGGAVFEALPLDEPVMEASDGAMLSAGDDHYQVQLKSGMCYHFAKTFIHEQSFATRISDPNGNYLAFERDDSGALTRIRDNGGQRIEVTSRTGLIRTMILGDKPLVSYRYDDGQLVAATDALGQQKRFVYQSGRLVRHMDTNRLTFHYQYDESGHCAHTWGDGGLYEYRFDHRPYERSVRVTDSLGHQKTYVYDQDRLPVKEQDHTGAAITYAYDDVGRVIQVTDPLERTTEYDYDDAGNVIEIIRPDNNRVVMVYDERHRPIQLLDANGKIWEQRFDDRGRLIEKITPLDAHTRYAYNPQGDLVSITDPQGDTATYEYDERGLVTSVIDSNDNVTRYQRNLLGHITAVIDPAGRATRYLYDEGSRIIQTMPPAGSAQHFEWDGEGNLLLHTDANGQQTRFEYGGVNEIIRRTNADGTTVAYQYDSEEHLTGVTNEKGQTHRFQYDSAGRIIAQTDYYGHTTHYTYDSAGQLVQSCDPLDRTIAYAYDEAGRLLSKTFESQEQEYFHWDANGNLTAVQSPGALVERFYDAANHLIAEKTGEFVVEYQYDANGRRTGRTTSHGNTVRYSYDARGAVAAVQINDQPAVTMERNALGQVTSEQISDHLSRALAYDEAGRLSRQTITGAAGTIERSYRYDPAGNLTAKQDSQKGPWQFSHDPMGRITEALDPEYQLHCFGYDPAGDLLEHLPGTGHSLRSARYNRTEYRFDAAGNLAERQIQDELIRFTWDEQNRLKTIRKPSDTRIDMTYDALGRRHIKAVNGERTFFRWDGDVLLSEQFEDGPAREYVYYPGTFEPLAVIDGDGSVYYYHNDLNGLPQELTTPSGEIVWSASYDATGMVDQILVDKVAQPLRMQGQYWDPEIGLCYNRHRYFDPQICSFISQDPLGLAAGENVYAYCPNVWTWVDPLGLSCKQSADFYVDQSGQTVPGQFHRYSHSSYHPMSQAKSGMLPAKRGGTYVSFDKIDDAVIAQGKMQIPYRPDYRVSGNSLDVIDQMSVPKGNWGNADHLEPITKDFRKFGPGKATQVVIEGPVQIDPNSLTKLR